MSSLSNLYRLVRFVWKHPLNSSGKLAAIGRVLRWQIAARMMPGPIAIPFAENTHLLATQGLTGATGNWYCGLHEVADMGFVLHFLREGDHFADIGANIGSYTVLAAGAALARATSVEPIPATYDRLLSNVAFNRLTDRVRTVQIGISDQAGTLRFSTQLDSMNHVLADGESAPCAEVHVTTLDNLVGSDVPILIKIDVEGHERSVLRGASRTLGDRRLKAIIMETNGSGARYGVSNQELVSILQAHGFSTHSYDPINRKITPGYSSGSNTLFLRDLDSVRMRVEMARRFRLINGTL